MRPDKNQEKIYIPLIRDFKNQTADLYKKVWINKTADFSGLFIPHVFDDYYSAKTKVFFIGQDTYGWSELEKTYTLSEKDYLVENNKWPKSIDVTLEWTNPYTFWNFVNRLQLAFNGEKYDSLQNLSSSQRKCYKWDSGSLVYKRHNQIVPDFWKIRFVTNIVIAYSMNFFCPFWNKIHLCRMN